MTYYSVHEPSAEAADLADRADALAFVKEGFSWWALFVPAFWLIYHRMWIELVIFLAVFAGLEWVVAANPGGNAFLQWVSLGLLLLFAFEANDLRRYTLVRRGYRLAGVAVGRGREEAELSFFKTWLEQQPRLARAGERTIRAEPAATRSGGEPEEVIGLFPGP